jgi:hypothetical protein
MRPRRVAVRMREAGIPGLIAALLSNESSRRYESGREFSFGPGVLASATWSEASVRGSGIISGRVVGRREARHNAPVQPAAWYWPASIPFAR